MVLVTYLAMRQQRFRRGLALQVDLLIVLAERDDARRLAADADHGAFDALQVAVGRGRIQCFLRFCRVGVAAEPPPRPSCVGSVKQYS